MFDQLFSAVLTFCVLAGSTAAIATAMLEQPSAEPGIVQLQRVQVTGKRASAETVLARAPSASDSVQ
ncbi:hypothetical protein [Piscinibacter sp.]|uniref:hypothetical protein n=1 Tax=Piscinibacter sp. TaxID=1903157 RepID=UPI002F42FD95